jgi:hypothetical protein
MGNLITRFNQALTMSEQTEQNGSTMSKETDQIGEAGEGSCDSYTQSCDQPDEGASSSGHVGQGDNPDNTAPVQRERESAKKSRPVKSTVTLKRSSTDGGQNVGPKQLCQRKSDMSCDHRRPQTSGLEAGDASALCDSIASCSSSSTGGPLYGEGSKSAESVHHINDLPHALLVRVFKHLSMKDLLQSAVRVCKYWRCLTQDPALWRVVSLKGFQKAHNDTLLQVTSFSDNVTSVDLSDVTSTTTDGVIDMLQRCTRLRRLKLTRSGQKMLMFGG